MELDLWLNKATLYESFFSIDAIYLSSHAFFKIPCPDNPENSLRIQREVVRILDKFDILVNSLNQRRLAERGIEFEQVVQLLSQTLTNQQLLNAEGSAVVSVISDYARSWSLLQGYDEQSLKALPDKQTSMRALSLDDALVAIAELKQVLIRKGEATELFGQLPCLLPITWMEWPALEDSNL